MRLVGRWQRPEQQFRAARCRYVKAQCNEPPGGERRHPAPLSQQVVHQVRHQGLVRNQQQMLRRGVCSDDIGEGTVDVSDITAGYQRLTGHSHRVGKSGGQDVRRLGCARPAAVQNTSGGRQGALDAGIVKAVTAEGYVIGTAVCQLPLPVRRGTPRLTVPPDSYNHIASTRREFNVLCLFRVHHIIENIFHRPMFVENGVESRHEWHMHPALVGLRLQ